MVDRPCQNRSGSTPLAGSASFSTTSTSSGPTSNSARSRYAAVVLMAASSAAASSAGFTSLQNRSIVRLASSSVMSPAGSCSTM